MASFALATQWWHVLLGRVFGWLRRGARTPVRNVLLTEATTPETYGRAFGLERAMDSAGAVVGPALALVLAAVGLRGTFALTLVPTLIAAALIAFLVREKSHLFAHGPTRRRCAPVLGEPAAASRGASGVARGQTPRWSGCSWPLSTNRSGQAPCMRRLISWSRLGAYGALAFWRVPPWLVVGLAALAGEGLLR